jgi:hypothetical protein
VATYFCCILLSHWWDEMEALLHDIQDKNVYELNGLGGIVKLQSFCRIACDAGYYWCKDYQSFDAGNSRSTAHPYHHQDLQHGHCLHPIVASIKASYIRPFTLLVSVILLTAKLPKTCQIIMDSRYSIDTTFIHTAAHLIFHTLSPFSVRCSVKPLRESHYSIPIQTPLPSASVFT